ncbi:MAG: translation initiation factor IF-2 [Chloroflexota bacterium]
MTMTSKQGNVTRHHQEAGEAGPPTKERSLELPGAISVRQLAELLKTSSIDVIKRLMRKGIMANINQLIDYEIAFQIARDLGYDVHREAKTAQESTSVIGQIKKQQQSEEDSNLKPRPPVVTIMGHVDHGKTRLLDAIRKTNVVDSEAGGITQHIGAYQVEINKQKITFLDTPGHQAFTAMRARGAQVTDIAILVVAADDGVMPQTLEAIGHAKAAGVPIMVAINKMDKPEANPDRVKQQLADAGVICEEWGGDTICVPTSAREGQGITELLENLLILAEMENLRADPKRPAIGVVIEAGMDKNRGPIATVLVHDGTLRLGDIVTVGTTWGRLKAMFNETGKRLKYAEPATPVAIMGLGSVPQVGDTLNVVADEHEAQVLIQKQQEEIASSQSRARLNLDNLFDQISAGHIKELNVVLRADVQGSIEPIRNSLEQLSTDNLKVRIIHSGTGNVTESDVLLALASKGLLISFSVGAEPGAKRLAGAEGVDIRTYNVIYTMIDDVAKALKGMFEITPVEVVHGRAEVRAVFPAGKNKVAGVYVTEGKMSRGDQVRVRRGSDVLSDSTMASLRRFKENVREVATGYEAGVGIVGFSGFQPGDILEFYRKEKVAREG